MGNLFCGFAGLLAALNLNLPAAAWFVVAGALFDAVDGPAARALKINSPIGEQLDSLADVVTFGLLPAVLMHFLLLDSRAAWVYSVYIGSFPVFAMLPFVILAASAWRLARFNTGSPIQRKGFQGLPTPASALVVASLPLTLQYGDYFISGLNVIYISGVILNAWFIVLLSVGLSWMMVSKVPLFKLQFSGENKGRSILLAAISAVLFVVVQWAAALPIMVAYVVLSLLAKGPKEIENDI